MALKPARLQWSGDGSLESLDYGDVYFQRAHGLDESRYVFLEGSQLAGRFKGLSRTFHIAEAGFGSGLNFLITAQLFAETAPQEARLVYFSFEKHPLTRADLEKTHAYFPALAPYAAGLQAQYPPLVEGFHTLHLMGGRIKLVLIFGDISDMLPQLNGQFDAWYLDGFSPVKNPDMWNESMYPLVAAHTKAGGTLATFSSAGHVRRGLKKAGFTVKKIKGFGFKWSMTTATMQGETAAQKQQHIAVLGAGIAGCAVAYALAQRGHFVSLVDRHNTCARETSGNPVGIVYPKLTVGPSPMGAYHSHAFCFTRNLLKSLALPSWHECGVTHLDLDPEDSARTNQLLEKSGFPPEYASQTENGLHQPLAGFLSPPEFCAALSNHPNIAKMFSTSIDRLGDIKADAFVIALGHGSKIFPETAWLPLQSLRGQITLLKATDESRKLDTVICHDGYITPAIEGLHCIGATFQKEEPENNETREEDDAENLEKLKKHLPKFGFTTAHIAGSRSGYRATTPDKLPLAGPCPDYTKTVEQFAELRNGKAIDAPAPRVDNVYISTGFGAHGMTGAPLAGEIIAAEISGDPCPVPQSLIEHLQPERFILRDLKRKKI